MSPEPEIHLLRLGHSFEQSIASAQNRYSLRDRFSDGLIDTGNRRRPLFLTLASLRLVVSLIKI